MLTSKFDIRVCTGYSIIHRVLPHLERRKSRSAIPEQEVKLPEAIEEFGILTYLEKGLITDDEDGWYESTLKRLWFG